MNKDNKTITITLEEYKELLEIKGRYEESKTNIITIPKIHKLEHPNIKDDELFKEPDVTDWCGTDYTKDLES